MQLLVIIFCLLVILSFFIDTQIPLYVYIIAGILAIDEIAVFLIGHVDSKQDKENRKIYKNYRRK